MGKAPDRPSCLLVAYALVAGGGETFPIFLANELRARGWPVALLDCAFEPPQAVIRQLLAPCVPLYRLRSHDDIGALCLELGIEIVHSCNSSTDLVVSRSLSQLATASRPRHVVTLHGGYEALRLDELLVHLNQAQAVDRFVYTADKNLFPFPRQFLASASFTRIPNALPRVEVVPRDRIELGINSGDAVVAMLISRAVPGKGWEVATEAVEDARAASGRDLHLVLIGDGPIYDEMRALPQPPWLRLPGVVGDVRSWIAMADVGLLPTTFVGESYPLILIDFLTMGVPVVASSAGEIPQMMAGPLGVGGFVVDETEPARLRERFTSHLIDLAGMTPEERAPFHARALAAAEKFSFDVMVDAYEHIYVDISSGMAG